MNLLLRRGQTNDAFGRVKFKLWARTELDDDEAHIIQRYRFDDHLLTNLEQPNLIRNTIILGFGAAFVTFALIVRVSFTSALVLALVAGLGGGYLYYDKKRESLFVRDLLHGRNFACRTVIELARKEAWLAGVTAVLRQVMETAKHWDGTETIPVAALDKEAAKFIAIKGL